jgi:Domain of unknown function (DUF4920)
MALTLSRFVVVVAAALLGCHTNPSESTTSQVDLPAAPRNSSSGLTPQAKKAFGAPIHAEPESSLANVLETPERFRAQTITVEGQVRSACTRRGCWMEVAQSADPKLPGCRVTFQDYGFFVPTDSAGAHAKVQGTLGINTLPPERVAHLESEGGRFPNKRRDGSVDELRLVATGVELWR